MGKNDVESVQRRRWLPFVALPLLVLLFLLLAFAAFRSSNNRRLEGLLDSIRAEGYPATPEELDDWYAPGEGAREAGEAYTDVFEISVVNPQGEEADLLVYVEPELGEPFTEAQLETSWQFLNANSEYLDRLHGLIGQYESVRYSIDLSVGSEVDLSHLSKLRGAVRLLALEALLAAEENDEARAVEALAGAFEVAETLQNEPLMISQLVRAACLGIAVSTTEQVVNRVAMSPGGLKRIQDVIDRIDCDGMTKLALLGERSLDVSVTRRNGIPVPGAAIAASPATARRNVNRKANPWTVSRGIKAYVNRELPGTNAYMDLELLNLLEMLGAMIEVGDAAQAERNVLALAINDRIETAPSWGHLLTKILIPPIGRVYEAENRVQAYLLTASSGLAALRFALDHQRNPADIMELVPQYISEAPKDPFNVRPLVLRSSETGFVVYSLGHDRDDDGGIRPNGGSAILRDGDIVFQVIR